MTTATPTMEPALREITERIRAAAADRTRLSIRGAGTKHFYGEPPQGEPLPTTAHAGITSYEPSELVVTARAGTPLAELEAALAERGQCLPFEPPRLPNPARPGQRGGTVGGMVAAGLSGPSRASVGAVRDYVLGASLVNGRGELLVFGGQVMKNVAGYDVSRVLAGSMGVLGVIADVSLKVLPVAPAEATLVFDCSQADALRLLHGWGGQPLPLNASRWLPQSGWGARAGGGGSEGRGEGGEGGGRLWLRLRGAAAAVDAACARLGGERQDPAQAAADWDAARDLALPWLAARDAWQDLWRLAVPQTAPVLPFDAAPWLDWHGGQRWYLAAPDAGPRLRAAARAAGGHATRFMPASTTANEHSSAANSDQPARFDALSPPLARIHRALVREFDPHAVFDHGRLLPSEG